MNRQGGFTLIELLVAMIVGMVILLAAFKALETYSVANATIVTRTDNTQRARLEMDGLIRALRSEVCVAPGSSSFLSASAQSVSFATDLSDGTVAPQRRTVTYDPVKRRITEARYDGTTLAQPYTFSNTVEAGPTLTGVDPPSAGAPIFDYFPADAPTTSLLAADGTVAAANLIRIARVTVSFRVGAAAGKVDSAASATLQDEVALRSTDPADASVLPLCT